LGQLDGPLPLDSACTASRDNAASAGTLNIFEGPWVRHLRCRPGTTPAPWEARVYQPDYVGRPTGPLPSLANGVATGNVVIEDAPDHWRNIWAGCTN